MIRLGMKKNIHPVLHKIEVIDGEGKSSTTYSTYPKTIALSTSRSKHPAWREEGTVQVVETTKGDFSHFDQYMKS